MPGCSMRKRWAPHPRSTFSSREQDDSVCRQPSLRSTMTWMFLQISPVSAESYWRVRSARRAPPRCSRSGLGSSGPLDRRIGRLVVGRVVAPSDLALADAPKFLDQLDAVDPLGHLVAVLMLDPQAQRRAVVDGER